MTEKVNEVRQLIDTLLKQGATAYKLRSSGLTYHVIDDQLLSNVNYGEVAYYFEALKCEDEEDLFNAYFMATEKGGEDVLLNSIYVAQRLNFNRNNARYQSMTTTTSERADI